MLNKLTNRKVNTTKNISAVTNSEKSNFIKTGAILGGNDRMLSGILVIPKKIPKMAQTMIAMNMVPFMPRAVIAVIKMTPIMAMMTFGSVKLPSPTIVP